MRSYEYHHIIGFEETNLTGNVYYANHIRWQGRCRELFLKDNASEIIDDLKNGLLLITTRVSCEYYSELYAFNAIILRMQAGAISQNRVTMLFDYICINENDEEQLMAKGEQQIACMREQNGHVSPTPIPPASNSKFIAFQFNFHPFWLN